jgi:Mg2+ and Co2+ transporter CorA
MPQPFRIDPVRGRDAAEHINRRKFVWIDLALSDFRACAPALAEKLELTPDLIESLGTLEEKAADVRRPDVHPNAVAFPVWAWNRDVPDVGGEVPATYQINVLIHGCAILTITDDKRHPPRLDVDDFFAHSEEHAVYLVLSAIFDTHSAELGRIAERIAELEEFAQQGLFKRLGGQRAIATQRGDLTALRRAVGPERRLFDRLGVELEHVEGLGTDHATNIDRVQSQLDHIDEGIDAVSGALTDLIGLRISAIGFSLTALATVLTPLAVITTLLGIDWIHSQVDGTGGGILLLVLIVAATVATFWWILRLWGDGPDEAS